jgi:hypothetical protein
MLLELDGQDLGARLADVSCAAILAHARPVPSLCLAAEVLIS